MSVQPREYFMNGKSILLNKYQDVENAKNDQDIDVNSGLYQSSMNQTGNQFLESNRYNNQTQLPINPNSNNYINQSGELNSLYSPNSNNMNSPTQNFDTNTNFNNTNGFQTQKNFYNTDVYVFEHLKCFLHNFEEGNIFKNMGSYFIIVFFICQIISTIVYAIYGIDIIKLHIIDFIKRNPPKKIKVSVGSEEELNEDEQKSELENKDIKNISDEKSEKNTSMNFIEEKSSKKNKKSIINNFVHKDNKAKKKKHKKIVGKT